MCESCAVPSCPAGVSQQSQRYGIRQEDFSVHRGSLCHAWHTGPEGWGRTAPAHSQPRPPEARALWDMASRSTPLNAFTLPGMGRECVCRGGWHEAVPQWACQCASRAAAHRRHSSASATFFCFSFFGFSVFFFFFFGFESSSSIPDSLSARSAAARAFSSFA